MCLDNLRSYDKELSLLLEEIHLLLFEKDVFNYAHVCFCLGFTLCAGASGGQRHQIPMDASNQTQILLVTEPSL